MINTDMLHNIFLYQISAVVSAALSEGDMGD